MSIDVLVLSTPSPAPPPLSKNYELFLYFETFLFLFLFNLLLELLVLLPDHLGPDLLLRELDGVRGGLSGRRGVQLVAQPGQQGGPEHSRCFGQVYLFSSSNH